MRPAAQRFVVASALVSLTVAAFAPMALRTASAAEGDPATELRVGTFNFRADVSLADFRDAMVAFKPRVDVAGLQEIGLKDKGKYLMNDTGWGYYRPPALGQNPIIWRRAVFDFVSAKGFKIADGRYIGDEYGTGNKITREDSWATVVRLVHRPSGQQVSVINVHLIHGAVRGGRPVPGRPRLYELIKDQIQGTAQAVQSERSISDQVYVTGDFNVGYVADVKRHLRPLPFKRFGRIDLTSMWRASRYLDKPYGTHNDALIDQVWSRQRATSVSISRDIRQSDHFPAVATYTLPRPAIGYQPNQGTVGFEATDLSIVERDRPFQIRDPLVFRLEGRMDYGHVRVQVVNGTAREGVDFTVDAESLNDNDLGHNHVDVYIIPNKDREPDKTFTLRLVNPVNTAIVGGADQATGTIWNDD